MDHLRAHPLLSQVPLVISPFVAIPVAVTLPFNYVSLSGTKVADAVAVASDAASVSDKVIESIDISLKHLCESRESTLRQFRSWDRAVREDRKRVAPGYWDTESHLLIPERVGGKVEMDPREEAKSLVGVDAKPLDPVEELRSVFDNVVFSDEPTPAVEEDRNGPPSIPVDSWVDNESNRANDCNEAELPHVSPTSVQKSNYNIPNIASYVTSTVAVPVEPSAGGQSDPVLEGEPDPVLEGQSEFNEVISKCVALEENSLKYHIPNEFSSGSNNGASDSNVLDIVSDPYKVNSDYTVSRGTPSETVDQSLRGSVSDNNASKEITADEVNNKLNYESESIVAAKDESNESSSTKSAEVESSISNESSSTKSAEVESSISAEVESSIVTGAESNKAAEAESNESNEVGSNEAVQADSIESAEAESNEAVEAESNEAVEAESTESAKDEVYINHNDIPTDDGNDSGKIVLGPNSANASEEITCDDAAMNKTKNIATYAEVACGDALSTGLAVNRIVSGGITNDTTDHNDDSDSDNSTYNYSDVHDENLAVE